MTAVLLELAAVVKDYRGLRPLRIDRLTVASGDRVAILGIDRPAAEVLVNLLTGASLPDSGEIRLLGRPTASIRDGVEWLSLVDRVGIVSERAALLDALSSVQNLAVPFSLDIEPPSDELRSQALALAREVGLNEALWDRPLGDLDGAARLRVRLGKALALAPALVLLEHPTAAVPREAAAPLGHDIRTIVERRGVAALTLTADADFAAAAASRVLSLDPASGRLSELRGGGWLARLRLRK